MFKRRTFRKIGLMLAASVQLIPSDRRSDYSDLFRSGIRFLFCTLKKVYDQQYADGAKRIRPY